jgi:hypothetical protein
MEFPYKDAIESWKSESKQYGNSCYLILLIFMMLNQFYDFVATCNLNP